MKFENQVSLMPGWITQFQADRDCLERLFAVPYSPKRRERMQRFYTEWQRDLEALPFAPLTRDDQTDWLLLHSLMETEIRRLDSVAERFAATQPLLPFAAELIALEEDRRALREIDGETAAQRLDTAARQIPTLTETLSNGASPVAPTVAGQAARIALRLRELLTSWYGFYHTYDPVFDWWVAEPYRALDTALETYARFLRERVAGAKDETILGEPIGRAALRDELRHAQVPYEPEELIAAAREERAWCIEEMCVAAREMGHGDDWRAALEQVKQEHEPPGRQPALVRELACEAIDYVEGHDLVTVPPVARECWRMEMMAAERQKVNPFFLGGEEIIVSFPTSDMAHERKRMSLRGNNRAFARATVHHELIPGHHLQLFSMQRHHPHRQLFWTAFWIEGWALHWEMLLWERDFARTPQERIGMLFWRLHRGVRVIFSLEFHLGLRTAAECVEMLVNEAGHERDNALAEVRRSFEGDYEPLYQCAYLVGGWQVHALYRELAGTGRLTDREFHDAMLHESCMPIPTLRAVLSGEPLTPDFAPRWRFHPLPEGATYPERRG